MDRPFDSIPRQGKHRGADVHEESTTNVRSQQAPHPQADDKTPKRVDSKSEKEAASDARAEGEIVQFLRNTATGQYRLRRWTHEPDAEIPEGFEEVNRRPQGESIGELLDHLPERPFIVLENTSTGEVFVQPESDLTGDWGDDGRFDQVTIFDEESAAEAYAESRQA